MTETEYIEVETTLVYQCCVPHLKFYLKTGLKLEDIVVKKVTKRRITKLQTAKRFVGQTVQTELVSLDASNYLHWFHSQSLNDF